MEFVNPTKVKERACGLGQKKKNSGPFMAGVNEVSIHPVLERLCPRTEVQEERTTASQWEVDTMTTTTATTTTTTMTTVREADNIKRRFEGIYDEWGRRGGQGIKQEGKSEVYVWGRVCVERRCGS
jgi:hypothetical protein